MAPCGVSQASQAPKSIQRSSGPNNLSLTKFGNKLSRYHFSKKKKKKQLLPILDKSTFELHFFLINSMLAKFPKNQKPIAM